MFGIDIAAFVRMSLLSLVLGAFLGCVLEIVRFIFALCCPKTVEISDKTRLPIKIIIAVRDVIFFFISGVAFAVFIYYTNNGSIRLFAVLGTMMGFFAFYFSAGRIVRKTFGLLICICHKLISFAVCPFKWMMGKCLRLIRSKNKLRIQKRNSVKCEDINERG